VTRSKGRSGRPWRRVRAQVLADNPTCWLCGHPIDLTLPATHTMSPTVDHVTALAAGGQERDPANLRPAHRRCNSRKGAGQAQPRQPTSRPW
jgi:5-methylcytosine-specific restriction endonuclease McrA